MKFKILIRHRQIQAGDKGNHVRILYNTVKNEILSVARFNSIYGVIYTI